jgi:hypothetical protein
LQRRGKRGRVPIGKLELLPARQLRIFGYAYDYGKYLR